MPLDTLLATLAGEAEAEAQAELQRGRAEAGAIATAATAEIERRRAAVRAALEQEQGATVERDLLEFRQQARRIVLEARRDLVAAVLEAARRQFLETLEAPAYLESLPDQVTEALACLADRPATLRAHPRLAAHLAREAGPRATVVPDATVGAGFRVAANDGSLEVDSTLDTRLQAMTPILSMEILARAQGTT